MKNNKINKLFTNWISILIPLILVFDWLMNLSIINLKLGLYFKGFLTFLFFLVIINNSTSKFRFQKVFFYFLTVFIAYSLFSSRVLNNLYSSIRIAYWVLGSMTFYIFLRDYLISPNKLKKIFITVSIIASCFTIFLMSKSEEHQNASSYLLLWCLPLLIHFKKSKFMKLVIGLAILSIILTIKRGAILALILSLFGYFLAEAVVGKSILKKLRIIGSGLIVSGIISLMIFSNWESISERLEDTGGSGRDIMYELIIIDYVESSGFNKIFGHGINSVQELTAIKLAGDPNSLGVAAHSDWLQNTYDFGVFGILFMFIMHLNFLKLIRFNYKLKTDLFPSSIMLYIIFSLTTIYSFILSVPDAIFMGISVAYISVSNNRLMSL